MLQIYTHCLFRSKAAEVTLPMALLPRGMRGEGMGGGGSMKPEISMKYDWKGTKMQELLYASKVYGWLHEIFI